MRYSVAETATRLPLFCLLLGSLAGCAGPYSILEPASGFANHIRVLWWVMLAGTLVISLTLYGLWWLATKRHASPADEPSLERNNRLWLWGGGVLLPSLAILGLLIGGIPASHRTMAPNEPAAWVVELEARQWAWSANYPVLPGVIENEQLHIPAGAPIDIHLTTQDVIHAFWIPRLGGKIDAIPGRRQVWRIQADEPGVYRGLCAEYCGVGHPGMLLEVVALTTEEFAQWQRQATAEVLASEENLDGEP